MQEQPSLLLIASVLPIDHSHCLKMKFQSTVLAGLGLLAFVTAALVSVRACKAWISFIIKPNIVRALSLPLKKRSPDDVSAAAWNMQGYQVLPKRDVKAKRDEYAKRWACVAKAWHEQSCMPARRYEKRSLNSSLQEDLDAICFSGLENSCKTMGHYLLE